MQLKYATQNRLNRTIHQNLLYARNRVAESPWMVHKGMNHDRFENLINIVENVMMARGPWGEIIAVEVLYHRVSPT